MNNKTQLMERMERERTYLAEQAIGTEEYNASMKRLDVLTDKLTELERIESETAMKEKQYADEKKDRFFKNASDIGKFIIGGVLIPVIGLVCITATEKDASFTGTLRDYTRLFIPKKM